jgi:SOS-response transcriptional repressor LexA
MIGTPRQMQLLDFIRAFIAENRVPPTQQQMGDHLRTSRGNVNRMIAILERNGLIWRFSKGARSIRIRDQGTCPHCQNQIGSAACRAAAVRPITYSSTPKQVAA